ncbi:MAG: zinc-binding dehydrogenase [Cyanobacteria bacterium J06555_13]
MRTLPTPPSAGINMPQLLNMTPSNPKHPRQVIVKAFGTVENLHLKRTENSLPGPEEVLIELTSIGMNQADLMARRGEYRLSSGEPPFTPGIEGGGVISAIGSNVHTRHVGQRVILTLGAVAGKGTYRSHFVTAAADTVVVPEAIEDSLIGALWLPFMTAWGALAWRQNIQPGQIVLLPAASSSVAIAASQIVKQRGGITIGTTTSPEKVDTLQAMSAAQYDHILLTRPQQAHHHHQPTPWWKALKKITQGHGVDVIFDPVAAGKFLHHEIRVLAHGGTLWVYGLLGTPGTVDVSPLIRKDAVIRGWLLNALAGHPAEKEGYQHILKNVADGTYQLPIAAQFPLDEVRIAQASLEKGSHIGKYILTP